MKLLPMGNAAVIAVAVVAVAIVATFAVDAIAVVAIGTAIDTKWFPLSLLPLAQLTLLLLPLPLRLPLSLPLLSIVALISLIFLFIPLFTAKQRPQLCQVLNQVQLIQLLKQAIILLFDSSIEPSGLSSSCVLPSSCAKYSSCAKPSSCVKY